MCNETNLVRDYMELPVDNNPVCVDCSPSKCPTTKQMESEMESVEAYVLDDCCARAGTGVGC